MEKVRSSRGRLCGGSSTMFVLALVLVACSTGGLPTDDDPPSASAGQRLSVVATTTILADMAGEVAGDSAEVSALIPAGSDPHNYEASAQQLVQLQEADLVVSNGADFEEQLAQALTEAARTGVPVFRATDHVDTLTADDNEPAGAGGVDPHFWQDPARAADVVRALGTEIAALADEPADVQQRASAYARQLEDLDREIEDLLAGIPDDERTLVTNHAAFAYFADRYDFTIVGTVIPSVSTGAEPSARDLEELADTIRRAGVRAVFTENTAPTQLAETLAQEVGIQVDVVELYSDALDETDPDAATYVDMLRTNARRIGAALGA